jgi:hypothetical protein
MLLGALLVLAWAFSAKVRQQTLETQSLKPISV